ncbi:hypothetical protein BDZ90DRAFT_233950 [Jaminaea rosea]|uniref:Uncharacterized protein n=1 Tax=Jaminaea rosea TaxID=1569628 RepID=A0A316UM95_9BASI|nr:hypothetical protein BDZ90DRAFT_233950 [Jaminaea rosea]PWN25501.1 hypothetical protein BDZ90DRAFT_233950 [Jaminaea rosea]
MSALASSSRIAPLTSVIPSGGHAHGSESPKDSYYSRMGSRSGSLSRASSISSTSSSRRGSASSAAPVVRNGFVIPSITLTPPDEKPARSPSLPWQDYTSKSTLYVPVKTEDIGWEEGGLWWHGHYEYREVQIYGGEDDRVVGKYRGGPEGYGYMEVWDQEGYGRGQAKKMEEPAPQKSSAKTTSSSNSGASSSATARRRSSGASSTSSSSSYRRRDSTDSLATDGGDSTTSSRRTSDSTVDTACTTPCDTPARSMSFSDSKAAVPTTTVVEEPAAFDKQLESALWALREEKAKREDDETESVSGPATVTTSTPTTATSTSSSLTPGKSLHLSDEGPSATHRWPKGRGVAKLAETPSTAAQRLTASTRMSSALPPPQSILPQ